MGDMGDFFREQKEYIKEKRQIKNNKYEPQLISMGAIKKSCGVYEFGDWLCYPTKGFAMNKRKTKERVYLDKFIKINSINGTRSGNEVLWVDDIGAMPSINEQEEVTKIYEQTKNKGLFKNIEHFSSPIGFDIKRNMCFEKKAYSSKKFASRVKSDLEIKRDIKLRVYQCPICGFWHLTSKEDNEHASI